MEVPGYDLNLLLGAGPAGEVWRARTVAGEVVALKRLTTGPDAAVDAAVVHRVAELWQAAATPFTVALLEVTFFAGDPVLVLDFVSGGRLADLFDRREQFGPGEIVTLGVPLAKALLAAHALGLVHGNISAANVLLSEAGTPMLADLGVNQMRPASGLAGAAGPAADIRAVGEVLQQALDRCPVAVPPALREAIAAAVDEDATARPDAATLASSLRSSCPDAPLLRRDPGPLPGARPPVARRIPAPDRPGAPAAQGAPAVQGALAGRLAPPTKRQRPGAGWLPGRKLPGRAVPGKGVPEKGVPEKGLPDRGLPGARRTDANAAGTRTADERGRGRASLTGVVPQPLLIAAGAAAALVAAAGVGSAWGRGGPATAAPLPPVASTPTAGTGTVTTDWRAELDRLDAARATAFSAVNPALLDAADAPDSPAMAADRAALAGLQAKGLTAEGVRHRLLEVRSVRQSATSALLRVVDERTEVTTFDATGRIVGTLPLRPRAAYDIELVRASAGWRLAKVTPVAATPAPMGSSSPTVGASPRG